MWGYWVGNGNCYFKNYRANPSPVTINIKMKNPLLPLKKGKRKEKDFQYATHDFFI